MVRNFFKYISLGLSVILFVFKYIFLNVNKGHIIHAHSPCKLDGMQMFYLLFFYYLTILFILMTDRMDVIMSITRLPKYVLGYN